MRRRALLQRAIVLPLRRPEKRGCNAACNRVRARARVRVRVAPAGVGRGAAGSAANVAVAATDGGAADAAARRTRPPGGGWRGASSGRTQRPPTGATGSVIHPDYEGTWRANTGNGYYGGLQMDLSSSASTAGGCSSARARRTAGRRWSRCGSRSEPTAAAGASVRGRTPRGCAASSEPGAAMAGVRHRPWPQRTCQVANALQRRVRAAAMSPAARSRRPCPVSDTGHGRNGQHRRSPAAPRRCGAAQSKYVSSRR